MVNLICNNLAIRGATVTVGETGEVSVGADGRISTEESLAAVLVGIPGYAPASEKDAVAIKEFVSRSVETPEGLYDPGELTRVFIKDLAGSESAVCASDNVEVKFDVSGYGFCGRKTAMALLQAYPGASLYTPEGVEVKVEVKDEATVEVPLLKSIEPVPLPEELQGLDEELPAEQPSGSTTEEVPETLEEALGLNSGE